jgi:hypothetical protein
MLNKKLFSELKNKIKNKNIYYIWAHIINNCDYKTYCFDNNSHQALCCFNNNNGNWHFICEHKNYIEAQTGQN